MVRARREDDRWSATTVRDLHTGSDPAARDLITVSGALARGQIVMRPSVATAQDDTAIGRVTTILLRLHADARAEARERRRAARDKVATLA